MRSSSTQPVVGDELDLRQRGGQGVALADGHRVGLDAQRGATLAFSSVLAAKSSIFVPGPRMHSSRSGALLFELRRVALVADQHVVLAA